MTVAVPDFVESSTETALTVSVVFVSSVATYSFEPSICVPEARALSPVTDQITFVFTMPVPVTFASKIAY